MPGHVFGSHIVAGAGHALAVVHIAADLEVQRRSLQPGVLVTAAEAVLQRPERHRLHCPQYGLLALEQDVTSSDVVGAAGDATDVALAQSESYGDLCSW